MKYKILKSAALFMCINTAFACESKNSEPVANTSTTASAAVNSNTTEDGPEKTGTQADPRFKVTTNSFGLIKITDNYDGIVAKYGVENVSEGEVYHPEAETPEQVTFIFKGQAKEIIVHWGENHKAISSIEAVQKDSPYKDFYGIGYGTTMKELETINISSISFVGFLWDMAGSITSFNMGDLDHRVSTHLKNIHYNITINDSNPPAELTGDVTLNTDDELVKKYLDKIYVNQIRIIKEDQ